MNAGSSFNLPIRMCLLVFIGTCLHVLVNIPLIVKDQRLISGQQYGKFYEETDELGNSKTYGTMEGTGDEITQANYGIDNVAFEASPTTENLPRKVHICFKY